MTRSLAALGRVADSTFASLRIRNYRLFFIGQVVSVSGSWMQRVAQAWLVLHLTTDGGLALGIVAALQFLPMLLLGAWGGLVADRVDKRRLVMVTQTLMGLLALVLGVITLSGQAQLWMVYVLALLLGLVTAIDNPARQSFVMELVGRRQITNAVSLNSAVFTGSRVIGPAIAGLLITLVGTGWCFVINAASFMAVLLALTGMDPGQLHRSEAPPRSPGQIREGLRFVWSRPDIRLPLALLAVVGTLALNWNVILPLVARDTFHGDATTFGTLFAVLGLGSLAGALFTASRREPSARLLVGALLLFGVLLLAAAAAPSLGLELAVLVPLGMAALAFQTTANSLIQLRSEPALRGRVMALYAMVFIGTTPFGAPVIGWIAQQFGPRAALALGGIAVLLAGASALWLTRGGRVLGPQQPARSSPWPAAPRPSPDPAPPHPHPRPASGRGASPVSPHPRTGRQPHSAAPRPRH